MSVVLVALAVALRLAWVLLVPTRPVGDFALYLESAAHLLAHHALDAEFIYMPGYVFLLAGVQALGGGLVAAKLIGVAAGGLGTWAVYTIALRLWHRTTALVAGLLFACWPAGIAVSSVTGTDMPAAALLAAAVAVLVSNDRHAHPWRAAVGFGVVLGLAAYVRAVAVPLAVLALPTWMAAAPRRDAAGFRTAVARTALGFGVACLLLLPWGLRNQLRYGELFLTDSHGGHTALVGANPNSEGVYSRSLNQMFWKGTGYRLFDPKPRDADRAAYALARSWAAFEPVYAVGLIAAKADRLLTHERPLLYWPLYRESVLRDPPRAFFDRHRAGLERFVDGFWYLLAAAAAAGGVLAVTRRQGRALSIVPFPLALVALYATFFSEVRYHLAIAIFMFPFAAETLGWLARAVRTAVGTTASRGARAEGAGDTAVVPVRSAWRTREVIGVGLAIASVWVGWPRLVRAGAELRARHRWAVCVCQAGETTRLCDWRAVIPAPGTAVSPVRGVWDGVGLRASGDGTEADTEIDLPPGRYRVTARIDRGAAPARGAVAGALRADGQTVGAVEWRDDARDADAERRLDSRIDHGRGRLRLALLAWPMDATAGNPGAGGRSSAGAAAGSHDDTAAGDGPTIWISDIRIEPAER